MSRKYLIAGNWKMNKTPADGADLAKEIASFVSKDESVEVVVCPTAVALDRVSQVIEDSAVKLGAQNLYPKASGAYTGEISAEMLRAVFAKYVILGHSERREYFAETDAFVNEKVKFALESNLIPILCIGETLEQREADETLEVNKTQLLGGMEGVSAEDAAKVVIAYEPVWAIGTGKTATPEMAQEVHAAIRSVLAEKYGSSVAEKIRILYGGSMKPANADDLLAQKDIDGGLIGGAALEAKSFCDLIESARKAD
ncbi:triose-phosphate isomerase [Pelagicoccus sp. SDUM812003]|uniref:triose-phosphate isomerase n=1 Tax=Pelagicoccus sp. SDUM812003 TaxID=3041267 RepID=UPI00280E15AA|nr:triose-phosphate isomerase [Pelagicoccus sp. SDUM812003]MDQ8202721.1 triose-phosphate isomerase [Pelagicoccus sp. SDUM812003]